jgi:uncharacterized protein YaiL (DUF2058 family)
MARTARAAVNAKAQPSATITPWQVDSANGESFPYAGGANKLVVSNASAGSVNVTVRATTSSKLVDGTAVADKVVAVGVGAFVVINEASTELQADGNVYVDYSATAATITAYLLQG